MKWRKRRSLFCRKKKKFPSLKSFPFFFLIRKSFPFTKKKKTSWFLILFNYLNFCFAPKSKANKVAISTPLVSFQCHMPFHINKFQSNKYLIIWILIAVDTWFFWFVFTLELHLMSRGKQQPWLRCYCIWNYFLVLFLYLGWCLANLKTGGQARDCRDVGCQPRWNARFFQ